MLSAIQNITRNGTIFTVARQDGTTFTFDQRDTTYGVATTSANGLMSSSDKILLNRFNYNYNGTDIYPSSWTYSSIPAWRFGNMAGVYINGIKVNQSTEQVLCTLATRYRPPREFRFSYRSNNGNHFRYTISTDGQLKCYAYQGPHDNEVRTLMWPVW